MTTILFVCTGNIFRSMIAEYALRKELGAGSPYGAASAGTGAAPQAIVPLVLECLQRHGIDPTAHRQRRIDRETFAGAALAVAMGEDHRDFLARQFGVRVPLFNEVSHGVSQPVLDTDEAVPDYRTNPRARDDHIRRVVDHICDSMPAFVERLPLFIDK